MSTLTQHAASRGDNPRVDGKHNPLMASTCVRVIKEGLKIHNYVIRTISLSLTHSLNIFSKFLCQVNFKYFLKKRKVKKAPCATLFQQT